MRVAVYPDDVGCAEYPDNVGKHARGVRANMLGNSETRPQFLRLTPRNAGETLLAVTPDRVRAPHR